MVTMVGMVGFIAVFLYTFSKLTTPKYHGSRETYLSAHYTLEVLGSHRSSLVYSEEREIATQLTHSLDGSNYYVN